MGSRLEQALHDFVEGEGSVEALGAAARDEEDGALHDKVLALLSHHEAGDASEAELRDQARGLIVGA